MTTKALITGGAGFIGSHLSDYLLAHGYHVSVLDNLSTGRMENIAHLMPRDDFSFMRGSILDEELVSAMVEKVDIVFHLAAAVGVKLIVDKPLESLETNVLGSHRVLRAANEHRKKILIASTSEVYGKGSQIPFAEDDDRVMGSTQKNRWAYAGAKAMDEFLALAYRAEHNLPVVVFRLFNTVGVRQRGRYGMVIPRFVQRALANEPIEVYGDGTQSRCFCDVSDVVRGIAGLAESAQAEGEVFNIGSTEEISIARLAERVIDITKSQSSIEYISYEEAYGRDFEDMQRRVPDTSKIKRTINWQTTLKLDEILQRVASVQT